jgi:ferric-dicitrate binding protein FerR (iron transport regulator)
VVFCDGLPNDHAGRVASEDEIDADAADWLARLDRADVPADEHAAFEAWCRVDERHLAAYLRLLSVWHRLDALDAAVSAAADAPRHKTP